MTLTRATRKPLPEGSPSPSWPLSTLFSSERPGWRCSFWSSTSWCSSCFCFSWSTARGWKPRLWWGHFQGWVESLLLIIIDHVSCWRPFLHSIITFIIHHCCSAMTILTIIRWEHLHGQRDQAMCWEVGARWDLPFPLELWNWSSWTMGSSFFLSMLSSYHSQNHIVHGNYCKLVYYPLTSTKGLSLPLLHSSQDYQLKAAKRRPQMIPRWGKSFATYPYTYRPIDPYKKRLWECNSSSQVWSGRGGIHPVFTNIEQHRAKVPFFAYSNEHLIIDFNINNICIQAAILIYIANQGRRVRRLRRLHVRRRLLTQLGSRQRHPWHSGPGEGSSPSS